MNDTFLAGKNSLTSKITTNQLLTLIAVAGMSFVFTGIILLFGFYSNKLYPRTTINETNVSGLTISQAITRLNENETSISEHTLSIYVDDIKVSSASADLEQLEDYSSIVNKAYINTHTKSKLTNFTNLLSSLFQPRSYQAKTWYEEEKLLNLITNLNNKVELIGEDPSVNLKISSNPNSISVFEGTPGRTIKTADAKSAIRIAIDNGEFEVEIPVASTSTVLNQKEIESTIERASKLVDQSVTFKAEYLKYIVNDKKLVSLIDPLGTYDQELLDEIINNWAEKSDREPQNAQFEYDADTLVVTSFSPHKEGLELDQEAAKEQLISWINNLESENVLGEELSDNEKLITDFSLDLPLIKTQPEISLDSTNDLGIKERIGFGESYYHHSIINRVHNVGITAERISLTIVPPGEEFSFNKTLGDVSKATGYRSAYVISGGKTVLGDGGGVCQVSSTLFRSLLDAGLDVTKRLQHSYRVSYYELNSDPGFDATVYSGEVDLRFVNDTDEHILLYSFVDLDNRYMNMEIYGTSDGRTTDISNYKKWDFRGPPATEYYPTTDLAPGQTKQIDWSVSGIKTEFTHTIKDKDGNITDENTYYSNYRPWSAKYLRGV